LVTEEQFSVVGCQFSVQSPLPGDDLEEPFCMYLQKEPADFPLTQLRRGRSHAVGLRVQNRILELFRGYQGMRNRVDRKGDSILDPDFAHEFGDVSFHSTLFDAQSRANFFVRTSGNKHLKYFLFRGR
jgi:hypothetical protein